MRHQYEQGLKLLLIAAGCVLLVACSNLANLMLARGLKDRAQTSIRVAFGCSRSRLVRRALVESVTLAIIGGALGIAVAYAGSRLILYLAFQIGAPNKYVPVDATPSWFVLLFALGVSVLTGIAFGIAPAWMTSHVDPIEALRGANRTVGGSGSLAQKSLVVAQVAVSIMLLSAAALLVRLIAAWTTAAAGLAAGLIFTVTPAVPFSLAHMPESLASVLWIGSQLLLLRRLHRPSVAALGLAGVAGAAATLTKPVFLYYEAVALVVILAGWQGGLGRRLAAGLIHAGLYALTLAPWYARNWAVWHTLVLTPLGGTHLYQHMRPVLLRELGLPVHDAGQRLNGGFADDRVPQTAEEWQRQFNSPWHNLARRSEVLGRLAAEDLVHYRAAYLRLVLRRHAFLYLGTAPKSMALLAGDAAEAPGFTRMSNANTWAWAVATGWWKYQVLSWGVLGFTYLAGAVGVCRAWRQRRWAFLGWGLLTLGYFAAITMPFNHSRYRFPMMPVFAGLAGCGMAGAGGGLGGPRAESVRAKSAGVRE
jgi:hypothetical protein